MLLLLSAVAKKLRQRISMAIMMDKKNQIEMGWVVYSRRSIKKKEILTPPKIKYVTLLLQPKNTIASLLIISEQHHPVAATLTTTQWLKISKESLMFYKVYFQRKFDNSNETFFVSFQTLLYTI